MFVAVPLSATLIAVTPPVVPDAAVIVNGALRVAVSNKVTVVGEKVMPVAVGVSVMLPPAAAWSNVNNTNPLAAPPSTMLFADDRLTEEGPSTTVNTFVLTVNVLHADTTALDIA